MNETGATPGTLTLIGSGELAASMSKVHRAVAGRVSGGMKLAVVDSPAGFEPNCADISAKAIAYLERHLRSKGVVASYRTPNSEDAAELRRALAALQRANYIFAGPGSPTYAVRCWKGSPVLAAIARRLGEGAQVVFASAAALSAGAYTLPVYEIFKAGADLHWVEGTDLLAPYGVRVAVVPHWNNAEGGTYDTSCCFMGRERFERLAALLDARTVILGIDEHTACTIDLAALECVVMGIGHVTVRRGGQESTHASGTSFALDALRSSTVPQNYARHAGPRAASVTAERRTQLARELTAARRVLDSASDGLAGTAGSVFALATALDSATDAGVEEDTTEAAQAALWELVAALNRELGRQPGDTVADIRPFLDLLVAARATLRSTGAWPAADAIRDGLAELGIALEDTPSETIWRRG